MRSKEEKSQASANPDTPLGIQMSVGRRLANWRKGADTRINLKTSRRGQGSAGKEAKPK